eukprot:m.62532 g.62532  ORF g.62532 m.62532 type:complete len:250 (+) comp13933_c1_seq20:83-832(+)
MAVAATLSILFLLVLEFVSSETLYCKRRRQWLEDGQKCVVFHHIPKSGGSSYRNYLKSLDKDAVIIPLYIGTDLAKVVAKARSSVQARPDKRRFFLSGHYGFDLTQELYKHGIFPNGSCIEATILRAPVQRVISAFYFHNQHIAFGKTPSVATWSPCLTSAYNLRTHQMELMSDPTRRVLQRQLNLCFEYQNDAVRRLAAAHRLTGSSLMEDFLPDPMLSREDVWLTCVFVSVNLLACSSCFALLACLL